MDSWQEGGASERETTGTKELCKSSAPQGRAAAACTIDWDVESANMGMFTKIQSVPLCTIVTFLGAIGDLRCRCKITSRAEETFSSTLWERAGMFPWISGWPNTAFVFADRFCTIDWEFRRGNSVY